MASGASRSERQRRADGRGQQHRRQPGARIAPPSGAAWRRSTAMGGGDDDGCGQHQARGEDPVGKPQGRARQRPEDRHAGAGAEISDEVRAHPERGAEGYRFDPTPGELSHHDQGERRDQAVCVRAGDALGQPLPAEQIRDVVEIDRGTGHGCGRHEGQRRSSRPHEGEQREEKQQARRQVRGLVNGGELGRGGGARDDAPEQVEAEDEPDQRHGQPPNRARWSTRCARLGGRRR